MAISASGFIFKMVKGMPIWLLRFLFRLCMCFVSRWCEYQEPVPLKWSWRHSLLSLWKNLLFTSGQYCRRWYPASSCKVFQHIIYIDYPIIQFFHFFINNSICGPISYSLGCEKVAIKMGALLTQRTSHFFLASCYQFEWKCIAGIAYIVRVFACIKISESTNRKA